MINLIALSSVETSADIDADHFKDALEDSWQSTCTPDEDPLPESDIQIQRPGWVIAIFMRMKWIVGLI